MKQQKKSVRREIKKQIIAGIDCKELVCLSFTLEEAGKELEWEHEKEFEFRGEMYDVVESETFGDSVRYWCWPDREETRLNQLLVKLVNDNLGNQLMNRDKQNRVKDFYHSLYFAERNIENPFLPVKAKTDRGYNSMYSSVCITPISPPPKIFLSI